MSKSRYKPGPWETEPEPQATSPHRMDGCIIVQDVDPNGEHVAFCFDDETGKANAQLIAASPDLLEACKMAFRWFQMAYPKYPKMVDESNQIITILFAAIVKAENDEKLTIEQRRLAADVDRIKREIKRLTKLLEELKHVNVH